ncbi:U32 family peptidase, partial [Patescibacteria group bacterium]
MKIIVGISNLIDIKPVFKAGADEVYCSLVADPKTGFYAHRKNIAQFNLRNLSELKKAVKITHKLNKKIYLAVNEIKFTTEQLERATSSIKSMDKIGLDGFIARDISFLLHLNRLNIKAERHLSTLASCFNSETTN